MSYKKNTRRTGARASAVPLPPPPPLTDLAEWPSLESSAARARTRTRNASATATGGNNRAQQRLGGVNEGGSLAEQDVSEAEAQDEYSTVTEPGTANAAHQAVLERNAQGTNNPAALFGSDMPQQTAPDPEAQEAAAALRGSGMAQEKGKHKATWDDPSEPFPDDWWRELPMGVDAGQALELWLQKGKPTCAICGKKHPPPHDVGLFRQHEEHRQQVKLEKRAKQAARERKKALKQRSSTGRDEDRPSEPCRRCGKLHQGYCRAPWCKECGSAHFTKKGEPCRKRVEVLAGALSGIDDPAFARSFMEAYKNRPGCSEEMRTLVAAILQAGDTAQAGAMMQAYVELRNERDGHQQQQQQQQQQPPRHNRGGRRSSYMARGRSASPRREDESGGDGSYRERSPDTRRSDNRGGGRGPSRRPPKNG